MSILPYLVGAVCVLTIGYRFYSKFIATRVLVLDAARPTPAHAMNDGQNYHPTNRWVLFGHHFAAITGAGPLIGPVLAAQFGFLPGFLWILIGVVLGGAVHDFVLLTASIRRGGRSLAEIAREELGPLPGIVTGIAILFIVTIAMAAMGVGVVNALRESAWGVFTIGCSIPIAFGLGLYIQRIRPGRVTEGTAIGVALLLLAVVLGKPFADSSAAHVLVWAPHAIVVAIAIYGFLASVLPVWLLLCPRDYLSSWLKIGTIALLIAGIFVVRPAIRLPLVWHAYANGGPVVPGRIFPFVFITIACGAISGFHALVGSGTTPKMIDKETDARFIGYGAMLMEGIVGLTSLIAACALMPGDYLGMNAAATAHGLPAVVHLPELSAEIRESLAGRTGGSVSLAVGMAEIFRRLPGMRTLVSYWYHFAIMFEALFILTTIDTGTRVARFVLQEFVGLAWPRFRKTDWLPGTILASGVVVLGWSYLLWNNDIRTLWPMLGIANQLLATIALSIGTTVLIREGRARYAWVTLLPMAFVGTTTVTAGIERLVTFWRHGDAVNGTIDAVLLASVAVVLAFSLGTWLGQGPRARAQPDPSPAAG